jgi:hypothetical protein
VVNPRADSSSDSQVLERRLGPFDGAAIIVSNVIGGGILFTLLPFIGTPGAEPAPVSSTRLVGGCSPFSERSLTPNLPPCPRAGGELFTCGMYGQLAPSDRLTSFVAGFSRDEGQRRLPRHLSGSPVPGVANTTPLFVIPIPYCR